MQCWSAYAIREEMEHLKLKTLGQRFLGRSLRQFYCDKYLLKRKFLEKYHFTNMRSHMNQAVTDKQL